MRDGLSLGATRLRYEISVVPKWPIPKPVVSHLVKAGLPANITAIAERAEEVHACVMLVFRSAASPVPSHCLHDAMARAHTTALLHACIYFASWGRAMLCAGCGALLSNLSPDSRTGML